MNNPKRILVVDDDMDTRNLFVLVLKEALYSVDEAKDGAEALDMLSMGGYDLVLLDAMMPKIDGLTVLMRLQTMQPKESNGPVVLSTNLSGDAIIAQAMAAGAKACINKTDINPDQLIEKVKGYIR